MQVELTHWLPGRVRLHVPNLRGHQAALAAIRRRLLLVPEVQAVRLYPGTGSLLLVLDRGLSLAGLLQRIGALGRRDGGAAREVAATREACAPTAVVGPGLSRAEVWQRQRQYGPNTLPVRPIPPFWRRLLGQFTNLSTVLLLAGTLLSALTGRVREVWAVGAVTGLNAFIGAVRCGQEDQALVALRALTPPHATVVRAGQVEEIHAAGLVPGDLVLLQAGDRVPADVLVTRTVDLEVEDPRLLGTGTHAVATDRLVRAGSEVLRGRAEAVVVATGSRTEIGRIAATLGQIDPRPSPVQRRVSRLARRLVKVAGAVLGIVLVAGFLRGVPPAQMVERAVSLAAVAVPWGLPTFITLALAAGARRLARRGAYVQDLAAAEGVGNVDVICTDKTGTLTQGEMTVRTVFVGGSWWSITGSGFEPKGEFRKDGKSATPLEDTDMRRFLEAAALCNNAKLHTDEDGVPEISGSQTEGALLIMAMKAGLPRELGQEPRLAEESFDPERRRMTLTFGLRGNRFTCSKGAPEEILPDCRWYVADGEVQALDGAQRAVIQEAVHSLATSGHRVLALSYADNRKEGFVFAGLAGIMDPSRRELRSVIRGAGASGIRTVMLTGDHPDTAAAVAHELGLMHANKQLVTGDLLECMSDRDLQRVLPRVAVFARVTPQQKARVIRAFQARGHTVAFIGDGVDDAAAMRAADVGVAPKGGSADVTREAATMILTGHRFETLVTAIKQGRTTSGNVNEIVRFLLTTSTAEILILLAAAVFGLPLPLLPLPLLWLNLIGDGPAALALGERHSPVTESMPGRPAAATQKEILTHGVEMGVAVLGLYMSTLAGGASRAVARTMALGGLAVGQIMYLFRCRTEMGTPCGLRLPKEPVVGLAAASSVLLLLATIYLPPLAGALGTVPLMMGQWLAVLSAGLAGNLSSVTSFSLNRPAGGLVPA